MKLLSRLWNPSAVENVAQSNASVEHEPLPPIVERRHAWPPLFKPTLVPGGSGDVLAMPLNSQTDLEKLPLTDPAKTARDCRYNGLRLVLLTAATNVTTMPPYKTAERDATLARILDPVSLDIDRWNTGLLALHPSDQDSLPYTHPPSQALAPDMYRG